MIDKRRIRTLNTAQSTDRGKCVIYWMSRDQRVNDNWALLHALDIAEKNKLPLNVLFIFNPKRASLNNRNLDFMFKGLKEVYSELKKLNIGFILKSGNPKKELLNVIQILSPIYIVSDFSPLKFSQKIKADLSSKISVPFVEVDTHNIIPCWSLSNKQEFAARTIRPKVNNLIDQFLTDIPIIKKQNSGIPMYQANFERVYDPNIYESLPKVTWIKPGEKNARAILEKFINNKLINYSKDKNDPNKDALSNLSPYLHFGQISSQRIIIEIKKKNIENIDAFLEEIIVRKELSDNFCFYNKKYNSFEGIPEWARRELLGHIKDKREYIYKIKDLEFANTHDDLWNACQTEMVKTGKMHGYMRMYWAKKILEWSENPIESIKSAIYLNDKYEIDGRDPNGYVGILWSIGGLHDRPFFTRSIIGKIRPMTKKGLEKKFDINSYIKYVSQLP